MIKSKLRVLHLPTITGNSAWYLSKHERNELAKSHVAYFNYKNSSEKYDEKNYDFEILFDNKIIAAIKVVLFYIWAIPRYDLFHFNSGTALFNSPSIPIIDFFDIRLLRFLGKKIVVSYQGSPARLRSSFIESKGFYHNEQLSLFINEKPDSVKRRRIEIFAKNANIIYATNPDLLINLPFNARFRPYTQMEVFNSACKAFFDSPIKIIHTPSSFDKKGTSVIIRVMEELSLERNDFTFSLITNVEREKILLELKGADLLIDQLLVGWFGGVAIEAMSFGVPVVAYINPSDLIFIPDEMAIELPIINANINNLKAVLTSILDEPQKLYSQSEKSVNFIKKWNDPKLIALQQIKDYISLFNS
jgi:glycosyltransferase involved in cell wall biosynthesis